MAVESKQGGNGTSAPTNGANGSTPGPAATLAGMPAVSANGKLSKRKRPSSLMAQANELPSVESSLDEFIARANETLVDPAKFNTENVRRAEDEQRKEADALRWKAAEQQMIESQAREASLRRQLDGLQGKLAEAEARAAVAGSGGSQDGIIADLKLRLTKADERLREAEDRSSTLATELTSAKSAAQLAAAASASASAADSLTGADADELEQRARLAEAKAMKALAAARAAAAGLTVSQADLAAIESGLVVPMDEPKKGVSWGGVIAAFIVGGAICFAVAFFLLKKDDTKPAAGAAGAAPAAAEQQPAAAPPAPTKPTVTPIEEPAPTEEAKAATAEQPAAKEEPKAAAAEEPVAKEEPKAAANPEPAAKEEPVAAKEEPVAKEEPAPKPAAKKVTVKKAAATKKATAPKAEKKAAAGGGGLADPFGGGDAAPAPKKKTEKKASGGGGGIVDPF